MILIGAAAGGQDGLHGSLAVTLIGFQAAGLDRHLLDVLDAWHSRRLDVSNGLHAARIADDAVHGVDLRLANLVIEIPSRNAGDEIKQRSRISVVHGEVFDLLEIDRRTDHVRCRVHQRSLIDLDRHLFGHCANIEYRGHIRHTRSLDGHGVIDRVFISGFGYAELVGAGVQSGKTVCAAGQDGAMPNVVGG